MGTYTQVCAFNRPQVDSSQVLDASHDKKSLNTYVV